MAAQQGVRRPVLIAVIAVGFLLLAVAGYFVWHSSNSESESASSGEAQPAALGEIGGLPGAKPADVPTALLCEYYEHGMEHTPPRDPSGAMQRRERHYLAPGDPFVMIESLLTKEPADVDLLQKVQAWQKGWLAGRDPHTRGMPQTRIGPQIRMGRDDRTELKAIRDAAVKSSLHAEPLMDIARAIEFLDDDESAMIWYEAGILKAEIQFASTTPGDPEALPFLHRLDQTRTLWRLGDYAILEKRFALAMRLNPPLSVESRRAGCLHATSLYYQARFSDAADAILKVWQDQIKAGDLGVLEQSDFGEMNWVTALYLYQSRRFEEALPYYQAFLKTNDNRRQSGAMFYAFALTQLGRNDEAGKVRHQYGLPEPMTRPASPRVTYVTTAPAMGPSSRPTTRITRRITTQPNRPLQIYIPPNADQTVRMLYSRDDAQIKKAVDSIWAELKSNPAPTVDKLNQSWLAALSMARQDDAIIDLATAATLAVAADTWRIEQLQQHRIVSLEVQGKREEARNAAKALFNVCGMGYAKEALHILADNVKMTNTSDPTALPKFKTQMLAAAQEDPAERKKLLDKAGGNTVIASIPADPKPYAEEIEKRKSQTDYRSLYGTGNLLLMSGRVKEARDVFMKVYQIAPPEELKYASEGIAKLIKAEEGGLGKANQFVASIRPRE